MFRKSGEKGRRSTSPVSGAMVMVFFIGSINILIWFRSLQQVTPRFEYDVDDFPPAATAAVQASTSSRGLHRTKGADSAFGKRYICPSAESILQQNASIIRDAYKAAEAYHNGGGNFKAIENYLNSYMDITLKKMDFEFFPDPELETDSKSESVVKTVIDLQRKKDTTGRGGYNQRFLPGYFRKKTGGKRIPDLRIDVIEPPKKRVRWEVGLGPIANTVCKSMDRIRSSQGKSYDDKFMCSYREMTENADSKVAKKSSCSMISIGSNGQWGFEEKVVRATDCKTHTFDCTVSNPRKPRNANIHFYPHCIANENKQIDGRNYTTYSKMMELAGLTEAPSLFKMDVEGFEFDVLAQMLEEAMESDSMETLPVQISVELHYATRMYDIPWRMRRLTAAEISSFMGMMYNRGGYLPVHYEAMDPGCYACAEMLFVRVFCD
eukprot:scaffold825_cov147-Cylindrotheca_fusiformis.AAC.4